jgi:preprotein translocase subunit SecD
MSRVRKRIVLCLLAGLVVAGLGAGGLYLYRAKRPRPDIHKLGGTLLVFEVDEDNDRLPSYQPEDLVAALKRRLDLSGRKGITVRLLSPTRVEVGVPRSEEHAEYLRQVKSLAAQTGRLEFRILANAHDDEDAIAAAEAYLRRAATDAKVHKELDERAARGQPPPPPVRKDGFVSIKDHVFTYTWLEVASVELRNLHLLDDGEDNFLFKEWRATVAMAREKGEAVYLPVLDLLIFSRPCRNQKLTEEERAQKEYDWFLLSRDPEHDLITGEPKAITGAYIESARVAENLRGDPAVHFHLNDQGGELLYDLTSQNKPDQAEGSFKRRLAIVLDGQVMMAPFLNHMIRSAGEISGGFTRRDMENLAIMLRAGSLPARLKPTPIEERAVEPNEAPPP